MVVSVTQFGHGSLLKVHKTLRDALGVFWTSSLRESCLYSEIFWSAFYLMRTEYGGIRSIEHFLSIAHVSSIYILWVGCRVFSLVNCRLTGLQHYQKPTFSKLFSKKKFFWKSVQSFLESICSGVSWSLRYEYFPKNFARLFSTNIKKTRGQLLKNI